MVVKDFPWAISMARSRERTAASRMRLRKRRPLPVTRRLEKRRRVKEKREQQRRIYRNSDVRVESKQRGQPLRAALFVCLVEVIMRERCGPRRSRACVLLRA